MSSGVTPNNGLPRLFFPKTDVASPLLCRYPKHARSGCACHGQPQPDAASSRATGTAPRSRRPAAAAPSLTLEQVRRRLEDNDTFIAKMLDRLRDFPEAAAAMSEMLMSEMRKTSGPPESDPPDFSYEL